MVRSHHKKTNNLMAHRDVGNVDEVHIPEETFGFCLKCKGKKQDWKEDYLADGYCVECWDYGLTPYEKQKPALVKDTPVQSRLTQLDVEDILNWVKNGKKPVAQVDKNLDGV